MFVSGLLQLGGLDTDERQAIEAHCHAAGRSVEEVLTQATSTLSGLSQCASLVLAPKMESPLKHIEFVSLKPGRALVVMVSDALAPVFLEGDYSPVTVTKRLDAKDKK
jgi:heat-inducible transcriptional repressor